MNTHAHDGRSIAIITSHLSFDEHGGSNYSIHRLAVELSDRGDDVTVYTLNFDDENHVPVPHDYGVEPLDLGNRTLVDGAVKLYHRFGELAETHDLLHIYIPGIMPLAGRWRTHNPDGVPVVGTLNGYSVFCTNTSRMADGCWQHCTLSKKLRHARSLNFSTAAQAVYHELETAPMLSAFDRIYCLSPAVRDIYADLGVDEDVLTVIPNMVDREFANDDVTDVDAEAVAIADGGGRDA
ncbi:MAG: glycosyltransferase family 4 protein [Natronomonas sp.]|nr:glycosyltransferase family 4 protein [Natronomonas sp.]